MNLLFLMEFIKNFKMVGSITPSSKYLCRKIVRQIDFSSCNVIVEVGAGTGVFTDVIAANLQPNTLFIVVELNKKFSDKLQKKYQNIPNVHVVNDSALNIQDILKSFGVDAADYIVSGIPFFNLKERERLLLFREMQKVLTGKFILFQYTLKLKKTFSKFFKIEDILKITLNIPPAYVIVLRNY